MIQTTPIWPRVFALVMIGIYFVVGLLLDVKPMPDPFIRMSDCWFNGLFWLFILYAGRFFDV